MIWRRTSALCPRPPRSSAVPPIRLLLIRLLIRCGTQNTVGPAWGPWSVQSPIEQEVAGLIVATLELEIDASAVDPQAPLFREGLGLDSIDALELALAISRRYGVELRADDENNRRIFQSLRALAAYIEEQRK